MCIEVLLEKLIPFFCISLCMGLFKNILRMTIAQRNIETEKGETENKEINIDKDLQKYFNYKE